MQFIRFLLRQAMFEQARQNMILNQMRPFGVTDKKIIEIMGQLPREKFIPEYQHLAYVDVILPVGHGEWLPPPKETARIVQALKINKNDKILLFGIESGYIATLLSQLGKHVYVFDTEKELISAAKNRFTELGINNISILNSKTDWEKHAPYQIIFFTGSLPEEPMHLQKNLGRNGQIFVIIGKSVMTATIIKRASAQRWQTVRLFETKHPPLPNVKQTDSFTF